MIPEIPDESSADTEEKMEQWQCFSCGCSGSIIANYGYGITCKCEFPVHRIMVTIKVG